MAVASAIAQISITVLMSGIEVAMDELRRQSLGGGWVGGLGPSDSLSLFSSIFISTQYLV